MATRGRRPAPAAPFGQETLFRRIGPAVGLTLLLLLYVAPPRSSGQGSGSTLSAALLAALVAMATVVRPWERFPASARFVPAFAYLLVVSLAREAPGGAGAAYTQVVMIPLVWIALFAGPREVAGGVLAVGAALFGPLMGGSASPGDLHHAALVFGGSAVTGVTIQLFFAQLRSHTSRLYAPASIDPLTGAGNRRAWDEELRRALVQAEKSRLDVSLVLFDVDRFKDYNNEHGHQAGDRLLKEVTVRWMSHLRPSDVLARVGGDEFALVLPNSPQWAARSIAERLCAAVPMGMSCSAGVTAWDRTEPLEALVARTDRALYRAKAEGRRRVVEEWSQASPAGQATSIAGPDHAYGRDGPGRMP